MSNKDLYPSIRPSLLLDFANAQVLDPRVTFTRASTATYFDDAGILRTAAVDTPRFVFDPVTEESLGLLIEESRTNLLTYSEQFDNAAWTKTDASITANAAVAPDGATTADKLVEAATANVHYARTSSITLGSTTTFSCYLKAAERSWAYLQLSGAGSVAYFNLATGVVGTTTDCTATISSVGNGWFRCTMTDTTTVSAFAIVAATNADGVLSYTGDGTSGIYVWGAQLEAGAFATSYIPTTSAQVTRAAESASMTGANFTSWFNNAEGTLYASGVRLDQASFGAFISLNDGTASNEMYVTQNSSVARGFTRKSGGLSGDVNASGAWSTGALGQLAMAYKVNDLAISFGGSTAVSDATADIPVVDRASIGLRAGGITQLNGTIKKLAYYPKRLTNAQLQALTK